MESIGLWSKWKTKRQEWRDSASGCKWKAYRTFSKTEGLSRVLGSLQFFPTMEVSGKGSRSLSGRKEQNHLLYKLLVVTNTIQRVNQAILLKTKTRVARRLEREQVSHFHLHVQNTFLVRCDQKFFKNLVI